MGIQLVRESAVLYVLLEWQVHIYCSGGYKGGPRDAPPGSKFFFHLYTVFGQKNRLAHPLLELGPPRQENPGSATVLAVFSNSNSTGKLSL